MLMLTFAFILNLVSLLASFVAYITPWMYKYENSAARGGHINRGLWGHCYDGRHCDWYFENDFKGVRSPSMPDWEQAVVALFGLAIMFHVVAFLVALCHVICCRHKVAYTGTIAALLLVVFIFLTISIIIYGVYWHRKGMRFTTKANHFHAAFYLGIVSTVFTLVDSLLYACYSGKYY